jgi:hypothetical protein
MNDSNRPPKAVRINAWGFETDTPGRGNRVPLFGVFLILFGLLLAAGQLFKVAQIGASALFLALGLLLVIVWLRDRNEAALFVGVLVTALAASDLVTGAGLVGGNGWGGLFVGVGVIGIALIRARERKGWRWPLVLGAFLCLWGGSDVAASNHFFDANSLIGPVLLVLLGVWVVSRSRGR